MARPTMRREIESFFGAGDYGGEREKRRVRRTLARWGTRGRRGARRVSSREASGACAAAQRRFRFEASGRFLKPETARALWAACLPWSAAPLPELPPRVGERPAVVATHPTGKVCLMHPMTGGGARERYDAAMKPRITYERRQQEIPSGLSQLQTGAFSLLAAFEPLERVEHPLPPPLPGYDAGAPLRCGRCQGPLGDDERVQIEEVRRELADGRHLTGMQWVHLECLTRAAP